MSRVLRTAATCAVAFGLMAVVGNATRETTASSASDPSAIIQVPAGPVLWQAVVNPVVDAPAVPAVAGDAIALSQIIPVTIKGFVYIPGTVTVRAGSSVAWTNRDNAPHTATGVGDAISALDSGPIIFGQTFTQEFDTAGTYPYYCVYHPNMLGTVIVTP